MSSNGGRAWTAIFSLLQSQKAWVAERLAEFELTPQSAHAMTILSTLGQATMSELAYCLYCDASNATGLVDRLERRGLVAREPSQQDRRAKVVRLTPEGARLNKRVDRFTWAQAPPAIAKLSAADQRALREILERAVANADDQRTGDA